MYGKLKIDMRRYRARLAARRERIAETRRLDSLALTELGYPPRATDERPNWLSL